MGVKVKILGKQVLTAKYGALDPDSEPTIDEALAAYLIRRGDALEVKARAAKKKAAKKKA